VALLFAGRASAEVTFNKDVLPIRQQRCQSCHRPGEIGPMPLIVYYQKTPLHLPKGTELHLTGHWDNSLANTWNPDPTATVRWGDQSWQEMLSAPMGVIVDRTIDPKTVIQSGGFTDVGAQ
jgi:hypothetical protein